MPVTVPKKLATSMQKQRQSSRLSRGWVVHIIEEPNKPMLSLCCFVTSLVTLTECALCSVAMHTGESGCGVGQLIVATPAAASTAVAFHVTT
jgi:hypothetical protein